jgi:class 3 adenylate cyclase
LLSNTFANGSEWHDLVPAQRIAQQTLRDAENEWEFVTLTFANAYTGYRNSERARDLAEAFRTGITAKSYMALRDGIGKIDVRDLLQQIGAPTIVIHDRTLGPDRVDIPTRHLAPLIPNARFVETDDLARAIDEFLREGGLVPKPRAETDEPHPTTGVARAAASGMTAILFADIADSTALTERLGDSAFREKARDLDAALRAVIRDHAGTCIDAKTLGDGVLAVFTSARQAIEAALSCGAAGNDAGLPLHLGLHAGDVIREDNNVYGGAVNIASRISGLSAPGEVLVSDTVRSLARTSAGVRFEDRGEREMKGVSEPVRVFVVREGE